MPNSSPQRAIGRSRSYLLVFAPTAVLVIIGLAVLTFASTPDTAALDPFVDGTDTALILFSALAPASLFAIEIVAFTRRWLAKSPGVGRDAAEFAMNTAQIIPTLITDRIWEAFWLTTWVLMSTLIPWSIPTTWATVILVIVLTDFVYYWEHRSGHRVSFLWSIHHSVHHSSYRYDISVANRLSAFHALFAYAPYSLLVLLGFHPVVVLIGVFAVLVFQIPVHTERIGRLGPLDRVFNTPSNHRVHHGIQAAYLDKNFGGILIIWDRIFGTYQPETEPPEYGLTDRVRTLHPVAVQLRVAGELGRQLASAPSMVAAARQALRPPQ